ncbi:MAG: flagellar hook assembly protein FlgD [Pseudomonadota bacterium]|nr:flagellar hook assembly protein FlgD [Pseudomonadota bacterium]
MTLNTLAAAGAASPIGTPTKAASGTLGSLSGNFTDFLSLLMTQLKNQDPTAPMDTNQFTSQLVQYSSVEQQINTNSNLNKLIQATQSNTVLQSSSLVGKQVDLANDHLTLQNGTATAHFVAPTAKPVNIEIDSASGTKVYQATMSAQAGTNDFKWDGRDSQGNRLPDGSYKLSVVDQSGTAIATTITGRVTGMQRTTDGVTVSLGGLSTDVGSIQSVSTGS